ncbi:MAG: hypothetical protein ACP5PZ_06980 [Bacteroidales bacterium]
MMKIIRIIILIFLIGIPLYMFFNKNVSYQEIMIGAFIYALLIVVGVYFRYFLKPPQSE